MAKPHWMKRPTRKERLLNNLEIIVDFLNEVPEGINPQTSEALQDLHNDISTLVGSARRLKKTDTTESG